MAEVSGLKALRDDARFATLAARLTHQDALDAAITGWSVTVDACEAMHALQRAGVAAGVCQNAADRYDNDPQLSALDWLTEVKGTKIGQWPVVEFPVHLSKTPAYAGGPIDRGAPCYGEDNHFILQDMLGFTDSEIADLVEQGIL